jgi:ArsR family transcriptional regulator
MEVVLTIDIFPIIILPHLSNYGTIKTMYEDQDSGAVLDDQTAARIAGLFSALSDASRVRIISLLIQHERSVGDLAGEVGLSDSAVSHHLRGLRQMRLVRSRKEGRFTYYALDDAHVAELFQRGLDHVLHG